MSGGVDFSVTEDSAVVDRVWCLDCHDRREPWVLRALSEMGVAFRHAVLEAECVCHSCGATLPLGLHTMSVRIPVVRPMSDESPNDPQFEARP